MADLVDLEEAGLDSRGRIVSPVELLEHPVADPRNQALVFSRPHHRVGLATASLSVRQD